jgi:gas vesicle protein
MDNNTYNRSRRGGFFPKVIGYALAMAVGAIIALLYAPKRGEETRADLKKSAQNLAARFRESAEDISERVQDIFGEVSEELEKAYSDVRGQIMAGIDQVKDKSKINKERYNEMIDEVIRKSLKGKQWSENSIRNLRASLQRDWEDIKRKIQEWEE